MKKKFLSCVCVLRRPISLFAFLVPTSDRDSGFRPSLFFALRKNRARFGLKTRSETYWPSLAITRLPRFGERAFRSLASMVSAASGVARREREEQTMSIHRLLASGGATLCSAHRNAGWRIFVLMIAFLLGTLPALAIDYNLLAPVSKKQSVGGENIFGDYMANFIPFVLVFAAMAAVVQMVIGGFEYALSEAITNKQEAKDRITSALTGLLLAMGSFLILNTINPKLTSLQLTIDPIPTKTAQQQQTNSSAPASTIPTANTVFGQQTILATDWQLQQLGAGGWATIQVYKTPQECENNRSIFFSDRCVQQSTIAQQQAVPEPAKPWKLQTQTNGQWINTGETFENETECEGRKQTLIQIDPSRAATLKCISE